ncbi:transposase family protein [Streptomyces sp. ALI-76-A]|uniref:transposase family protein n=1 Tax=Streptomyces sp. ALI-76-A TaxID=3025736 RepID=UPI00336521B6
MIISVLYAERSGRNHRHAQQYEVARPRRGVARVERLADGRRRVHLPATDETASACPTCGVFATRAKGSAVTRPRDLPYGESGLELGWHKCRWFCREPAQAG